MIDYKPFEKRKMDTQYEDLLKKIIEQGKDKVPIHARLDENKQTGHQNSRELTGQILSYDLENGFPIITTRDCRKLFKGAIGEICAFINGARTLQEIKEYGCPEKWWSPWVTASKCKNFGLEEGDLGQGSYGASLGDFKSSKMVEGFDQVDAIMRQMKKLPFLRTHCLTTWNPVFSMGDEKQNQSREVVVAPCHGNFVHFTIFEEMGEIEMTHTQRSCDLPVGGVNNIMQWTGLGMMIAHLLGYKFTKYTHFFSNVHFYDIQREAIEKLLDRIPSKLPTVVLNPNREITHLKEFRPDDFEILDYYPHGWVTIPTTI